MLQKTVAEDGEVRLDTMGRRQGNQEVGWLSEAKETTIGSVIFADDTTLVAMVDEEMMADEIFKEVMRDWDEKINESKMEQLYIRASGRREMDVQRKGEVSQVRHVGGWLEEKGGTNRTRQKKPREGYTWRGR